MNDMREFIRLFLTLTLICLIAGALLALVNKVTEEPIAAAKLKETTEAIKEVLPPCDEDHDPMADTNLVVEGDAEWLFYIGRKEGEFVGAAFAVSSPDGYGGDIKLMVGVNAAGQVQAIAILEQKETPGLGANIDGDKFKGQFKGKSISDTRWAVSKDGGEIDQITAATISSRAVVNAVKGGLDVYQKHAMALRGAEQLAP